MGYKLSSLAEEDVDAIYEYTLLTFGKKQALKYADDLHKILNILSESPLIGHEFPEIGGGVLRHDHQKHAIFYRRKSLHIFVIRILHQQMEPMKHFF